MLYGNPPHVSDAIELLAEAWESIRPNSVASCWKRAKCLSHLEWHASSDIPGREEDIQCAQVEMLHTIAEITPTTAISSMLQSNGLEYISNTVHSLTFLASNMFHNGVL